MQVNPLAETRDGRLVAADAKLGFDDNAHFRQNELFDMKDESQEDPRLGPRVETLISRVTVWLQCLTISPQSC